MPPHGDPPAGIIPDDRLSRSEGFLPVSPMTSRIALIARHDSFLTCARTFQTALAEHGYDAEIVDLKLHPPRGRRFVSSYGWRGLLAGLREHAACVLLVDTVETRSFQRAAAAAWRSGRRPVLVSAFPGLLFRKQRESLLARAFVDLLCLNSDEDLALYREVATDAGLSADNAAVVGLPILHPRNGEPPRDGHAIWLDQPDLPEGLADRMELIRRFCALAAGNPDRTFVIKPRYKAGTRGLHKNRHPPEAILAAMRASGPVPANVVIRDAPFSALLEGAALVASVSSTGLVEAAARGIPILSASDVGVSETLGNSFFLRSGAVGRLSSVDFGRLGPVSQSWMAEIGGLGLRTDRLASRLGDLIARRDVSPGLRPLARPDGGRFEPSGWRGHLDRVELGFWEMADRTTGWTGRLQDAFSRWQGRR